MKPSILIIDDERNTREGLKRALDRDYEVVLADNARYGLDLVGERAFDLILTDLKMPGMDGVDFIRRVNSFENPPGCILLTAYGGREIARDAQQAGAVMYLEKPVNLDYLEIIVAWFVELRRLKLENRELKRELAQKYAFEQMIGKSAAMQEVFDTITQVAPATATVLLTGESGTGKELAARALHQLSNRADRPFKVVHCAALSDNLLESELFGHEKGAFTGAAQRKIGHFEAADGGTVFLDEIGEISPAVQVTLLRFLETRAFERVGGTQPIQVDVRLIAATNRDLNQLVADGDFREDLYYRLHVIQLEMPPLRDRREDIALLLGHFLQQFAAANHKPIEGFSDEARELLTAYDWPGNVRELRNCVERMVVLCRKPRLEAGDVPREIRVAVQAGDPKADSTPAGYDLEQNERRLIARALEECDGVVTRAAAKLGISRRTLHRKLNHYGLH